MLLHLVNPPAMSVAPALLHQRLYPHKLYAHDMR